MAQTGQPGGRQGLANTRQHGPIHSSVPEEGNAKSKSMEANVAKHTVAGAPKTNRRVG